MQFTHILLRNLEITYSNQVWMVDITYLRMPGGFMYLVAFIDVYSRYVVAWSLSNTVETAFCIDALKTGLATAKPEIINSDQGRCSDNVFIERFWRSFKREEFYLNEYSSIKELRIAIKNYITFYNYKRWHQSLDYKRPAEVYFGEIKAAA